jgi:hypothetical protein
MSNIPEARRLLNEGLHLCDWDMVRDAVKLLDRKKPAFVAPRRIAPLTDEQKSEARRLRHVERLSQADIATRLGTIGGRISEALREVA